MTEALRTLRELFGDFRSAESVTLLLIGFMLFGFFIVWNFNPRRALVAWLVTFSIQLSLGSFHVSVSDIFLIPLALGTFIAWMTRREKGLDVPAALLVFLLIFLTWGNIVTALTLGRLPQWTWLNKDLGLIALFIPYWALITLCRDRADAEKFLDMFVRSVSIVNFIGVVLYFCSLFLGFGDIVNYGGMRFKGFVLDPNSYAGLAGSTAILQFSILNLSPKRSARALLSMLNCCFLIAGCLLTLSRGGVLALVAGVLVLFYFTRARSSYTIVIALAAVAVVTIWLAARTDLESSIQRRTDDRGNIDSRIDYMEQGARMYLSSPVTVLTGIGIGTFIEESPKYFGDQHQIHNTYVWLLVEGGPLLFLAYLVVLYRALRQNLWVFRYVRDLRYAAAGCFCALITTMAWSMTVEGMFHHHLWILLAISELLWFHSRRERLASMPVHLYRAPGALYQVPAVT
jgi:hypothetical protein